jgi:hypothetical protein
MLQVHYVREDQSAVLWEAARQARLVQKLPMEALSKRPISKSEQSFAKSVNLL